MKKLMFAIAVAATVGFAHADAELTSTGFEAGAYTAGNPLNTEVDDAGVAVESYSRVWASATDVATVKAYGADGAEAKPTITGVAAEDLGNNYLAVEGKIERLAQKGGEGVNIGTGLYIDTIVQFTASDAETTSPDGIDADNDKLCIWLKSDGESATTGHIVVTAGFIYNKKGQRDEAPVSYVTDTQIADKSWHHLQVKALSSVDEVNLIGDAFVIYIDGQKVSATTCPFNNVDDYVFTARAQQYIGANSWSLFPSIQNKADGGTITSLTFNGSGSVDNIEFTQGNDPNPILIPAALEPVVASEADRTYTGDELTGVNYPDDAYGYELTDHIATEVGSYEATATLYPGFAWTGENNTPIYTAKVIAWSIVEGGSGSDGYDSGDGTNKFTIDSAKEATLTAKLPTGKTLGDVADATTGMTYAQAYALGLFDEETGDVADLGATISIDAEGKVTVSLANAPMTGYLVTCKVYEKASLTAEWPSEATTTYAYGSEQAITPASSTAGFYKVEVVISNAQ